LGLYIGYKRAQRELDDLAKKSIAKTQAYVNDDILMRDKKGLPSMDDVYLRDSIKISILPRWYIKLLGKDYVIRQPLRANWDQAWFMTLLDSNELDRSIQILSEGTQYELKDVSHDVVIQKTHDIINLFLKF
jgi:hypothetical protein